MLYGKLKTSNDYGFLVEGNEEKLDSYVIVDDDIHWELIQNANKENKVIVPDDKGRPILADNIKPKFEETVKQKVFNLKHYLSSTDWYVIRFAEEGTPIPTEVKQKRHNARIEISKLSEIVKE